MGVSCSASIVQRHKSEILSSACLLRSGDCGLVVPRNPGVMPEKPIPTQTQTNAQTEATWNTKHTRGEHCTRHTGHGPNGRHAGVTHRHLGTEPKSRALERTPRARGQRAWCSRRRRARRGEETHRDSGRRLRAATAIGQSPPDNEDERSLPQSPARRRKLLQVQPTHSLLVLRGVVRRDRHILRRSLPRPPPPGRSDHQRASRPLADCSLRAARRHLRLRRRRGRRRRS